MPAAAHPITFRSALLLLGAALAAAPLGACRKNGEDEEDAEREVAVRVRTVARGTVHQITRYTGEVRPSASVNVLPRMAERIVQLGFEEGDWVTQDETVMAELATELVDTGVRQARSGAEALTAQINGLQTQQERLRRLVADGVVAASQLDPIDAQIRALQAQRRQVLAGVDQANLRVDDTIVKAPMTGYVSQRFVDVGDMASPMSPLATIVRLDPVLVWVDVPEHEVEQVRGQTTAHVHVEVAPKSEFAARLELVSPTVDRESRSVRIRYEVDNPDLVLRDGMLAVVDVEIRRREDVIVVPTAALVLDPTQKESEITYTAWVVEDDRARRVTVRRGMVEGDRAEILSGLAVGDRLVVEGFHMLDDDVGVEVVEGRLDGGADSGSGTASGSSAAEPEAKPEPEPEAEPEPAASAEAAAPGAGGEAVGDER